MEGNRLEIERFYIYHHSETPIHEIKQLISSLFASQLSSLSSVKHKYLLPVYRDLET